MVLANTNLPSTDMALTNIEIRKAKPSDRLIKLPDRGGLPSWVSPMAPKDRR